LEPTPEQYVAKMVEVFAKVRRVLRDDGVLWLNMGDSYVNSNLKHKGAGSSDGEVGRGETPDARLKVKWQSGGGSNFSFTLPNGLKPKDLCMMPARVALALQADGWYLRSDVIWCLSGGTRIYAQTQNGVGPAMLKDLVRLRPETVRLWNGQRWTQVTAWSEAESREGAIEIEFRSGERVGCTLGHFWPTERGLVTAADLQVGDIVPDAKLPDSVVGLPDGICPVIGEVVGLFLAEGNCDGKTMMFSLSRQESHLAEYIERFAAFYGDASGRHVYGNTLVVRLEGTVGQAVIRRFVTGRTSKDKRLSLAAWRIGDRFLRAVAPGYLWGDGHEDEKNKRWRLGFTQNDGLAADLRCLAAHLGATVSLRRAQHTLNGKEYPGYRGEWRWERSGYHNEKPMGQVVAIRRSRARKFWDVTVADAPHVFALASGLLTHNSKPNPMPESVTDRPTRSHEYVFLLTKSARYWYDADAVREPHKRLWDENNGGSLDARSQWAEEAGALHRTTHKGPPALPNPAGRNLRTVWTIATQPFPGAHFATFPEKLITPCILAGCPHKVCAVCGAPWVREVEKSRTFESGSGQSGRDPTGKYGPGLQGGGETRDVRRGPVLHVRTIGFLPACECGGETRPGIVCDPFMGSGTVGLVAEKYGRVWAGCDLSADYINMATERIERAREQLRLPMEVT
jgi:hypothetical protein